MSLERIKETLVSVAEITPNLDAIDSLVIDAIRLLAPGCEVRVDLTRFPEARSRITVTKTESDEDYRERLLKIRDDAVSALDSLKRGAE